jgi:S1-C subfamily serine protease
MENNKHDGFGLSDADIARIRAGLGRFEPEFESDSEPESEWESASDLWYPVPSPGVSHVPTPDDYELEEIFAPEPSGLPRSVVYALLFLAFMLGMGVLGFGIGAGWSYFQRNSEEAQADFESVFPQDMHSSTQVIMPQSPPTPVPVSSLADIVELLEPAVVAVTTLRYDDPWLPDNSLGSGIIFAESAERVYIATSFYVVRGGLDWFVRIGEFPPLPAHPVGRDPNRDLAVVGVYKEAITAAGISEITIATFGDSTAMRVGDVVLAIGNAMGEGNSTTRGVISAPVIYTALPGRGRELPVFQTDAAINYGMGGGPLVNARGEVIGINVTQTLLARAGMGVPLAEGMSYSICAVVAYPLLMRMINPVPAPSLGIMGQTVSEAHASMLGIPPLGVLVSRVIQGGGAYRGGLMATDIITGFAGQPVFTMEQLQGIISALEVGDTADVNILREGRTAHTLTITLAEMVINFDIR